MLKTKFIGYPYLWPMYVHYSLFFSVMSLFGAGVILVGLIRRFLGSTLSIKLLSYKSEQCSESYAKCRDAQRFNGKMMIWSGVWMAFVGFVLLPVDFSDRFSLILAGIVIPVSVLTFRFFTEKHLKQKQQAA